jgi:hypothetical protein
MNLQDVTTAYRTWTEAVKRVANQSVYKVISFVTNSSDTEYGSKLQRMVCKDIGIPESVAEEFWIMEGNYALDEAIRRKRNTLTTALCNRFAAYCKKGEHLDENGEKIPPPDPRKIIPEGMWKGKMLWPLRVHATGVV